MKKLLLQSSTAALLSILSFAALAGDEEIFDDRFYVAPMASVSGTRGDQADSNGIGGSLAIGKSVMPHLGIELIGDYLHYKGKTVTTPGSGVLCGILPCASTVTRYPSRRLLVGGAGVNVYFSKSNSGLFIHGDVEGGDRFAFNGGVGYDQSLFGRAAYLRLEVLAHKEIGLDAKPLGHLGIRIPFGSQPHAVPAASDQPVQVVPLDGTPSPEGAVAPDASPLPSDGSPSDTSQALPTPLSEEQPAAPADPAGDAAPQPAADTALAADVAPAVESVAEAAAPPPPAAKKLKTKRHKKAKVAKASAPVESPDSTPSQVEPATSSSPVDSSEPSVAPVSSSEPAVESAVPPPAAPPSSPSDDEAVPTEPALAPPASKQ